MGVRLGPKYTLGFDNFEEARNDFIMWINYVRYACALYKELIPLSLLKKLKTIDFPIGRLNGNQDTIARSIHHYATGVAQVLVDKIEKNYFKKGNPVTLAVSLALKPGFGCSPLRLMTYLKEHLGNLLRDQLKIKNVNSDSSLHNLYAIILDTCQDNMFPQIAVERHGVKFPDGFTNSYACLYNSAHPLVGKGSLIYSKIPFRDSISI